LRHLLLAAVPTERLLRLRVLDPPAGFLRPGHGRLGVHAYLPRRARASRTYRPSLYDLVLILDTSGSTRAPTGGRTVEGFEWHATILTAEVRAGERLALLYSQELGLTQSAFLTAQARLNVAEQAFARATFLLKEKVIGKGEFQRREGDLVSARAQTKEAKNHLKLLGMTDEDIAAVGRTQEIRSSIPIVAPFAGRVIHRDVRAGEVVETMQKLFALADLSTVWVLADVPEKDIGFVQYRGDDSGAVEVQVSAYPGQFFRGKVVYRGDVLDAATRTMRVRVEVSNSDGRLKPEMYATVRVVSKPEPDAITIPKAAVQQDHGESIVFVRVNEQEFGRRVIHIAEQNDKHVHVLDGLTEGEEVVVVGAYMLKSELARQQEGAVGD